MKFLVFVKATPNSEQGIFPPDAARLFAEMGKFNEQLVKAGIMKEADGLKPSKFGKRIRFSDHGAPSVIDGPFAETKELVAGYWIWEVQSLEEAVEWAKRCPNPMPGEEGVLEIRPVYTLEDLGEFVGKDELAKEAGLRKQLLAKKKSKAKKAPAKKTTKRRPTKAKAKK